MDPITFVATVVGALYVILLVVLLLSKPTNSKCTNKCGQGRHCTCDKPTEK